MGGRETREPTQERIDVRLGDEFARELPELSVPWEAVRPDRPRLLALNEGLAVELGLDPDALRSEAGVRFLLGNELAPGSRPVAQAYAGHQFGGFSPRLGDGRALLLGEIVDAAGETRDLHLKGSGRTPFARADGFAATGPMLREYAVGEAMHALGIPTTRALAVVGTGRLVPRDGELLPGAVLVRVAASHLRVGSFQYAAARQDRGLLTRLADFAIRRHYPALIGSDRPYLGLLREVIAAQAELVASWMLVGFVHGVMNTDNTTISGETIDYGPCAFLDAYDPAAVFSSIDHGGRYAYGAQPTVMLWNLTRLAEAMLPLLGRADGDGGAEEVGTEEGSEDAAVAVAEEALATFAPAYQRAWTMGMRAKLGLAGGVADDGGVPDDDIAEIAAGLLQDLRDHGADYTLSFRDLAGLARAEPLAGGGPGLPGAEELGPWYGRWIALRPDADAMDRANPIHIPRNRVIDEALEAASTGDPALFDSLIEAVTRPFDARPDLAAFAAPATAPHDRYRTFCGT